MNCKLITFTGLLNLKHKMANRMILTKTDKGTVNSKVIIVKNSLKEVKVDYKAGIATIIRTAREITIRRDPSKM